MTKKEILKKLSAGEITEDQADKMLEEEETKRHEFSLKVTPKGCIGIYGIRRMPISLYYDEFMKIKEKMVDGTFDAFFKEHKSKLSIKG